MADVDGVDVGGPPLEEAVGEATGGGARIERAPAFGGDRKPREGGVELLPTPADERLRRALQHDGLVGRHLAGRLVGLRPRHQDDPGGDGHLGLVTVGDQAPPHELGVEPTARPCAQLIDPGVSGVSGAVVGAGFSAGAFFAAGAFLAATVLAAAFLAAARSAGALVAAFFLTADGVTFFAAFLTADGVTFLAASLTADGVTLLGRAPGRLGTLVAAPWLPGHPWWRVPRPRGGAPARRGRALEEVRHLVGQFLQRRGVDLAELRRDLVTDQVEYLLTCLAAAFDQVVHPLLRLLSLDIPGARQLPDDLLGAGPRDLAQHRTGIEVLLYSLITDHTQEYIQC